MKAWKYTISIPGWDSKNGSYWLLLENDPERALRVAQIDLEKSAI